MERIPGLRERVCMGMREDLYLVVWVDHDRRTADLLPMAGGQGLVEDVPWEAIRPVRESKQ